MKISTFYKLKAFPYASARKTLLYQQWNPLRKLSKQNKRIFRGRNRLFSLDSSKPLPKEVFLKIITNFKNSNFTTFELNDVSKPKLNKFNQWQTFCFSKKNKDPSLDFSYYLVESVRKAFNWNIFRYIFLRKMWMLSNPSLVPGIARPFKFKKNNLMKIRALKALTNLLGDFNYKFINFLLKKSWNMPNYIVPFSWNISRTFDSLQRSVLLKIGLVFTIPITGALILRKKVTVNGFINTKTKTMIYPGDYINFGLQEFFTHNNVFKVSSIDKHLNVSNQIFQDRNLRKKQKFNIKKLNLQNK